MLLFVAAAAAARAAALEEGLGTAVEALGAGADGCLMGCINAAPRRFVPSIPLGDPLGLDGTIPLLAAAVDVAVSVAVGVAVAGLALTCM